MLESDVEVPTLTRSYSCRVNCARLAPSETVAVGGSAEHDCLDRRLAGETPRRRIKSKQIDGRDCVIREQNVRRISKLRSC